MDTWSQIALGMTLLTATGGALRAQTELPPSNEVRFVENAGQWPESVHFAARGAGWRAHVGAGGWSLALAGDPGHSTVVRFQARDMSGDPPLGEDPGGAPTRFFTNGRTCQRPEGARSFGRVRCGEIAPGIDLVLRVAEGLLEYDLELAEHGRLEDVVFSVEGAELEEPAADGTLTLWTPLGPLVQKAPRAFEIAADGTIHDCPSELVRLDATHFALRVAGRRAGMRLVVDPALIWSTYVGGGATQTARSIADAGAGRTLITGTTDSFDFPMTAGTFDPNHNGGTDVFVTEFDDQGQILWSTFLGGLGLDEGSAIAVDATGAVTVAGTTRSRDFPATAGAFDTTLAGTADGFVARFSPDGSQLLWATYLGGGKFDSLCALAVDILGEVTVAGLSSSLDFPTTPGAYAGQLSMGIGADAVVARLFSTGSAMVWGTYLGGSDEDRADAVVLDPTGGAWLAGSTRSPNFPRTLPGPSAGEDGFVALLDASGGLLPVCLVLGGGGEDALLGLVADGVAGVFAGGRTTSHNLTTTPGAFDAQFSGSSDGYLVHVDGTGTVHGSTYLGGGSADMVTSVALAPNGELIAAGETQSSDFPTTPGAYDRNLNLAAGNNEVDAFVVRITRELAVVTYGTFFGAGGDDRTLAIASSPDGSVLMAGETTSYFFPTSPNAHRTSRGILALVESFASRLALVRHPIPYGQGKVNSYGGRLSLGWEGFPSIQDNNFAWLIDAGIPNQPALVFYGTEPSNQPFLGGTLYVRPPIRRGPAALLDFVGYANVPWGLPSAWIGRTFYGQAWCRDPADLQGCGLSNGLRILIYP